MLCCCGRQWAPAAPPQWGRSAGATTPHRSRTTHGHQFPANGGWSLIGRLSFIEGSPQGRDFSRDSARSPPRGLAPPQRTSVPTPRGGIHMTMRADLPRLLSGEPPSSTGRSKSAGQQGPARVALPRERHMGVCQQMLLDVTSPLPSPNVAWNSQSSRVPACNGGARGGGEVVGPAFLLVSASCCPPALDGVVGRRRTAGGLRYHHPASVECTVSRGRSRCEYKRALAVIPSGRNDRAIHHQTPQAFSHPCSLPSPPTEPQDPLCLHPPSSV